MEKIEYLSVSQLTFAQKLNLMETLWDELTKDEKKLDSPSWHDEILKSREVSMKAGKVNISDWEEAKIRIRRNVSC